MVYIDIHCHLDILKNTDEIINEAKEILILTAGINNETNKQTLELSKKYNNVKPCLGIYPEEAAKMSDTEIEKEIDFIKKQKPIAIGEVGLDKTYPEFEKQKQVFKKMILLAKELDIPLIIHSRKAEEETIEILEQMNIKKVIMHCFSGKKQFVEKIQKNKWYLSIPANVAYSTQFQENVKTTDIKQLFCETDSPFLHPKKEFPNTPKNVIESYKKISEIKEIPLKKVESLIEQNFKRLFNPH